ncbi:hypothetical protein SEA_GUDMIT_50 [Gordonia phage Gudmit]|nr:hypothetical protein SEA_GUDMIT_50 [Gordonia phage Gudmit]
MSDNGTRHRLRPIDHEKDQTPLSVDEVQESGDLLAKELRRLILAALDESVAIGQVGAFNSSWRAANIRGLQRQSQRAVDAWQRVNAASAEILDLERRMTRSVR